MNTRLPYRRRFPSGITLTEVVVASSLLIVSLVPILKAMTTTQMTARLVEQKTIALVYAEAKLDRIKARSVNDFTEDFSESTVLLGNGCYGTVTDDGSATLKTITVSTGFDNNQNTQLDASETVVTLTTLIAKRN